MAASLAAKIKKAERAFGKARRRAKEEGMGKNLPDAAYRGRIKEAKIGESGNGRLQHILAIKISEGESKGEVVRKYSGMDTEDSLMYLQKDIGRLGHDGFDNMDELEEINTQLIGVYVRFKLVTKGEFQNLYIDKVLGTDDDADDNDDDDTPEVPAKEVEFEEGERVSVEIDGDTYEGTIQSVGDYDIEIVFDDGDIDTYDVSDVMLLKTADDEPLVKVDEPEGLDVGDRVIADIDGTDYAGEITEMDGDTVTVKFDDGDVDDFNIEDLDPEEASSSAEGDVEVKKGSEVEVKVGRKTIDGVVTMVSSKKGTINFKDDEGNVYKNIPIGKILTAYGDEE